MKAASQPNAAMDLSQRVYARLLRLYPRAHREEYGGAMAQLFRDECRDAWNWGRGWGLVWLWLRVLPDLMKTAMTERLSNRGERKIMVKKTFGEIRQRPMLWVLFAVVAGGVFMMVLLAGTIYTFILPEAYASKARIKVERQIPDTAKAEGRPSMRGIYDPYFIRTEIEVIQSEKILDQVIDKLDLNTVWGNKYNLLKLKNSESRALLRRMIDVRPARNTSLIDITVFSGDREEAKRIANTTAEVFQTYRQQQWEYLVKSQFENAKEEFAKLKDQLRSELADKTNDPKVVDEKITETIAQAGKVWNERQQQEAANGGILTEPRVEIIEHAEVGFRPVRPNKPLNIFLSGVVGALAGVFCGGVIVFGLARGMRSKPAAV